MPWCSTSGARRSLSSRYAKADEVTEDWELTRGSCRISLAWQCKAPEHVGPVCCTPDGLFVVAGGSSGKVFVWEAATGSLIKVLAAP